MILIMNVVESLHGFLYSGETGIEPGEREVCRALLMLMGYVQPLVGICYR